MLIFVVRCAGIHVSAVTKSVSAQTAPIADRQQHLLCAPCNAPTNFSLNQHDFVPSTAHFFFVHFTFFCCYLFFRLVVGNFCIVHCNGLTNYYVVCTAWPHAMRYKIQLLPADGHCWHLNFSMQHTYLLVCFLLCLWLNCANFISFKHSSHSLPSLWPYHLPSHPGRVLLHCPPEA